MSTGYRYFLHFIIFGMIYLMTHLSMGQEILEKVTPKFARSIVDTLFIDNNVNNWSLRAFTTYKNNTFRLENGSQTLKYVPNNPIGVGLGFANSKIKLDFSINVRGQEENPTDRFSLTTDMTLGRSVFGFRIARFRGFEVRSDQPGVPDFFRRDIKTFGIDLFYSFLRNGDRVSISSVISGTEKQIKNAGSVIAGAFMFYHQLRADSSILAPPIENEFNTQAQIEDINSIGLGIAVGYAYNLVFAKHYFFSLSGYPGVGLNVKKVTTEVDDYIPDNLVVFTIGARASIGYNGPRYYIEFSNKYNFSTGYFNFGNSVSLNASTFKLAFGWKWKAVQR